MVLGAEDETDDERSSELCDDAVADTDEDCPSDAVGASELEGAGEAAVADTS